MSAVGPGLFRVAAAVAARTGRKNELAGQRKTGAKAGKAASKVLRGGQYSKTAKTAAGSALREVGGHPVVRRQAEPTDEG